MEEERCQPVDKTTKTKDVIYGLQSNAAWPLEARASQVLSSGLPKWWAVLLGDSCQEGPPLGGPPCCGRCRTQSIRLGVKQQTGDKLDFGRRASKGTWRPRCHWHSSRAGAQPRWYKNMAHSPGQGTQQHSSPATKASAVSFSIRARKRWRFFSLEKTPKVDICPTVTIVLHTPNFGVRIWRWLSSLPDRVARFHSRIKACERGEVSVSDPDYTLLKTCVWVKRLVVVALYLTSVLLTVGALPL